MLLFLLALPFTGLSALWEATRAATPVLLGCVVGALLLANAVIGADEGEELRNPALRFGALALGVAVLPLAVIAAIATGLRIGQHGVTPDRLWAVVFVALATAYGLAFLLTIVRRRSGWATDLRVANLRLAFAVAAVALVLATPIVSFNRLSADEQVARLSAGKVAPERFDWAALAFDFGNPGKRALARLRGSANPLVARLAREAAAKKSRYEIESVEDVSRRDQAKRAADSRAVLVRPRPAPVPLPLRQVIFGADADRFDWMADGACLASSQAPCQLFWEPGRDQAIVVQDDCSRLPPAKQSDPDAPCSTRVQAFRLRGGKWRRADESSPAKTPMTRAQRRAALLAERRAVEVGDVIIREVRRRQLFVGGKPVGDPFNEVAPHGLPG